ncbi:MAG: Nramp family divalent metal transporter [Planctomycetia bacterium]|nr:Nramp family divalent metal transporter [Planctomycetia bacterium]
MSLQPPRDSEGDSVSSAAAQLPQTCLPTWEIAELPEPIAIKWRHWRGMIGPAIVMMGIQIGGGEWLLGPEVTAKYGGGLMWLATISILLQVFYNMECGRYALYCGEPIFTGFLRMRPGPTFWVTFFLLLSVGAVLPGLAFNSASVVGAMWLDRPPAEADRAFIVGLAYGCLGVVILPVLFGGKIYNTLQAIMSVKVVAVLSVTFLLGVWLVSPESWWNVFSGFLKFGSIPTSDAAGKPAAVNVFAEWFAGRQLPTIELQGIAVIAAFAGVAGGGGLSNSLYSNYVRDKGWGMGSLVGAIPSAVGGQKVALSHLGKVFIPTTDNLRKWRAWWRYIIVEQWAVWTPGCFVGMALPALLSMQFADYSPLQTIPNKERFDWVQAVISADGLRHYPGLSQSLANGLWIVVLITGLLVLLPSQLSVVEDVCRRWTDAIWSANRHVRETMHHGQVKFIYYSLLAGYVVWSCFSLYLFGMYGSPKMMFVVVANFNNVALGVSSFQVLWVNTHYIPRELRPKWYQRLALVGCAFFYLGLAALVFWAQILPNLTQSKGD